MLQSGSDAADAASAGVAGFIVPDLPLDESSELHAALAAHDLALVQMALFETWRESKAGRENLVEAYSRVGGVAGALERLLLPAMGRAMEQVYRKQLRQLDNVAHARAAAPASAERTE